MASHWAVSPGIACGSVETSAPWRIWRAPILVDETDPRIEDAFVTRAPRVAVVISDTHPQMARYNRLMTTITALVMSGQLRGSEAEIWIAHTEAVRDGESECTDYPIFPTST